MRRLINKDTGINFPTPRVAGFFMLQDDVEDHRGKSTRKSLCEMTS